MGLQNNPEISDFVYHAWRNWTFSKPEDLDSINIDNFENLSMKIFIDFFNLKDSRKKNMHVAFWRHDSDMELRN